MVRKAQVEMNNFQPKEPNATIMLIRQDQANTFRVMCFGCVENFDVFGIMAPADDGGECSAIQRCMEHLTSLGHPRDGSKIAKTRVMKNLIDPIYKLTVTWAP
jgi:hypothetical protein